MGGESVGAEAGELTHLVDDNARRFVLAELQVGVDHVVPAMHLATAFLFRLRRAHRLDVGRDRFLPIADAGIDVRGHVLRMRRRRRDLGVAVRGFEALLRSLRIVIEVDQIVRYAGMLRQTLGDRFE